MKKLIDLGRSNVVLCASFDAHGNITWHNKLFASLFKNALGKNFSSLVLADHHVRVQLACLFCNAHPGEFKTVQLLAQTVGHKWSSISLELFFNKDENIFGIVGVKVYGDVDINSEQYGKVIDQLKEIRFIQSHEFRPPVARLLGLKDLISYSDDINEIKSLVMMMGVEANNIDAITKKVIDKSQTDDD